MKKILLLLLLATTMPTASWAQNLEIHVINVGQGSSTLIKGPNGTLVLFDGGKAAKGADEIVPYLQSKCINPDAKFDYMIVSHRDIDHYGGLTGVINAGYDVDTVYDNGSPKMDTKIPIFLNAVATTAAQTVRAMPLGHTIDLGNGAKITCVVVGGTVIGGTTVTSATNENDIGIGLLVQYGDFEYLACGDLGGGQSDKSCTGRSTGQANVETQLADALITSGLLTSQYGLDVIHVNHHGSESSTNSDYMNKLTPEVAVISTGPNGYKHPRKDVVESVLLAQATSCVTANPALVLQTDEGDVPEVETSTAGFVVGDIVITTTGVGTYTINGSGEILQGSPDERVQAGLPRTLILNESTVTDPPVEPVPPANTMITGIGLIAHKNYSWKKGIATITVTSDGNPVDGAQVDVTWSGSVSGNYTDITNSNGTVVFTSPNIRDKDWTFTVRIDNISKDGFTWDQSTGETNETVSK